MTDFTAPTTSILQPLIKKPTLKAALLQKPPFRFLHDIVTNLQLSTTPTFPPKELFDADQLNSENVKEKEQKIAFLDRLTAIIAAVLDENVDLNAAKVIAGLEPEKTNIVLQQLAKAALKKMDTQQIINKVTGKPATNATPAAAALTETAASSKATPMVKEVVSTTASSSSSSSSSLTASRPPVHLPAAPDTAEDYTQITQRLLGSLITKPTLKANLLQKPPFRFLHDIVTALINSPAQYPAEYFTADEADSSKVDNTDKKVAYLKKLIDIIQATIGCDLSSVQPKKIVAGLEPEQTNLMLQQLARAAASGIRAADAAKSKGGNNKDNITANMTTAQPATAETEKKAPVASKGPVKPTAAVAPVTSSPPTSTTSSSAAVPKLSLKQVDKTDDEKTNSNNSLINGDEAAMKIERPMTARQGPPKLKSNLITEDKKQQIDKEEKLPENPSAPSEITNNTADNNSNKAKGNSKKSGLILEGETVEEDEDMTAAADESDEKTAEVSLNNNPNNQNKFEESKMNVAEQGGLMRKILEATANNNNNAEEKTNNKTANKDSNKSVISSQEEKIHELRGFLQKVCHSVNPLGKCMEFLIDDLDEIHRELTGWKNKRENYRENLEQEIQQTKQILEPLQLNLLETENKGREIEHKIINLKIILWKNEQTIQQLLTQKFSIE